VIAVICHGSLYPYAFQQHGGATAAVKALLASWKTPPTGFADGIANVFLYLPLGYAGVLAVGRRYRLVVITVLGLLLSAAIEIAQFSDLGRFTNMSDVYCNTIGTLLGALAGTEFDARLRDRSLTLTIELVPVTLLTVLVGYRLYPYVPTIDVHKYWHSVGSALSGADVSRWKLLEYFVLWLTTCYLLDAALRRFARIAIPCFVIILFAAKVVTVNLSLSASELIGAAMAVFFWLAVLEQSRFRTIFVTTLLGAMVVLVRLQPFEFHATAVTSFGWVPFHSIVEGSLGKNFVAFGEKIFLYGSLIWIASRSGLSLRTSTMATAVLLFITSLAETHIPGRSAEITDGTMALLLGAGIGALEQAAALRAGDTRFQAGPRNLLQTSAQDIA